jgi:hypothetical protein
MKHIDKTVHNVNKRNLKCTLELRKKKKCKITI